MNNPKSSKLRVWLALISIVLLSVSYFVNCSDERLTGSRVIPDPVVSIEVTVFGMIQADTIQGVATVTVFTSDTSSLSQVALYIDDVLVSSAAVSGFMYSWDTRAAQDGSPHSLHASLYRANGDTMYSDTLDYILRGTAPAVVSDLTAETVSRSSIVLRWTATGDDGYVGRASSYEIRYSPVNDTGGYSYYSESFIAGATPSLSGSTDSVMVSQLIAGTEYRFWITVADELYNRSDTSIAAVGVTGPGLAPGPSLISSYGDGRLLKAFDFNNDSYPDIIESKDNGSSKVHLNQGDGTFDIAILNTISGEILDVQAADLDLDGDREVVILSGSPNWVRSFFNNGSGQFPSGDGKPWPGRGEILGIGDIDSDDHPDVLLPDLDSDSITVLHNLGTIVGPGVKLMSVGGSSTGVLVGEFTGDSNNDLIVSAGEKWVYAGDGMGNFTKSTPIVAGGDEPTLADVDADGDLDIIWDGTSFTFNDDGEFTRLVTFDTGYVSHRRVAVGDLNGDGLTDLVTSRDSGEAGFKLILANGVGSYEPADTYAVNESVPALCAVDLDQDGIDELLVSIVGHPTTIFKYKGR